MTRSSADFYRRSEIVPSVQTESPQASSAGDASADVSFWEGPADDPTSVESPFFERSPLLERRWRDALGIVFATLTLLLSLALWSYDARGGENLIGPIGNYVAAGLASAFGLGSWLLACELGMTTVRQFRGEPSVLGAAVGASTLVIVLVGCAVMHLSLPETEVFGGHLPGGMLGELLGEILRSVFGSVGSYIVAAATLAITMILRTPTSAWELGSRLVGRLAQAGRGTAGSFRSLVEAWREAGAIERGELADEDPSESLAPSDESVASLPSEGANSSVSAPNADPAAGSIADSATKSPAKSKKRASSGGPTIVAPKRQAQRAPIKAPPPPAPGAFVLPPPDLLGDPPPSNIPVDAAALRSNAERLVEKLASYGVRGRVDEIHPGPVVTMYEFEPQSGTKLSKIQALENDLALALAAQKVRIVAPIPGKARVGIELPNEERQTVYLREILEDERWVRHHGALPVALGKDIAGKPVYGDLAKMPHLLVAGATGSGKSVGLNVMLASLLAKKTPDEVRMLMIDPKVVELAVFDEIPHMLLPVVTNMQQAALALKWAVDEMERRYQLFADAGARSIATFNQKVDRVHRGDLAPEKFFPGRKGKVRAQDPNGQEVLLDPDGDERPDALDVLPEKLPFVVVVVDEFADLMMVAAKDVEACIARLAQKARAAGIHVILATQRPSVDVITGMIKANFPARIAFKVSQREDSKTILGRMGAQNLLGMGDMLMIPPGASELRRVHCAYISEDEVRAVCDFLRQQGKPAYDTDILKPREEDAGANGQATDDPQYDRAVAAVAQAGYCSISHIQRQLSVGYNKAAKLVERMEKEGVVGPPSGKAGGRREVLINAL